MIAVFANARSRCVYTYDIMACYINLDAAAQDGDIGRMERWIARGACPTEDTCTAAAKSKDARALRWLRHRTPQCPWDIETAIAAAEHNRLANLQWAYSAGCPTGYRVAVAAANGCHLDTLKWLHRNNISMQGVYQVAIHVNSLDIMKWVYPLSDRGCLDNAMCYAAKHANTGMLAWLMEHGEPLTITVMEAAALSGNLSTVKWLRNPVLSGGSGRATQCPWGATVCAQAARSGNLVLLQWLRKQQPSCPWDQNTALLAGKHLRGDVLAWAINNGCDNLTDSQYHNFRWKSAMKHICTAGGLFLPGVCLAYACIHTCAEGWCTIHQRNILTILNETCSALPTELLDLILWFSVATTTP